MSEPNWIDALSADDLNVDEVLGVVLAGRDIAVYAIDEDVYASDDLCTHDQARLSLGRLDGYEIECPQHAGRFDVRDGRPIGAPATAPLRTYAVKVEDGRVWISLD